MSDLKAMTDRELLAEYRVAAIGCDNQFQHMRMLNAEAELLRRLQPESQAMLKSYSEHVAELRAKAEPQPQGRILKCLLAKNVADGTRMVMSYCLNHLSPQAVIRKERRSEMENGFARVEADVCMAARKHRR